jgi:CDP-2,3-bis-(O-geranylgeranyl)-sn-glycerol synthase
MLPIYIANMAPPFVKYWHGWNRPISLRHLGSHKTVVGFALGVVMAVAVSYGQSWIAWGRSLTSHEHWILLGIAAGSGAMLGDSLKSWFKRRLGIVPGRRWIPFDQLDFVLGGLLALSFWIRLSLSDIILILVISVAGDIAVNQLSYRLGVRDTSW